MLVEVEASCADGTNAGIQATRKLWRDNGSSCDNIWQLQQSANRMKRRNFPSNGGNWRTNAYNQCARSGVDTTVQGYERQCLNDNPQECLDLGETAAEIIVNNYGCTVGAAYKSNNYKKTCRQVAYGYCQGQIPIKTQMWCSKIVSASDLIRLQNKCQTQVNSMTGGDDDAPEIAIN